LDANEIASANWRRRICLQTGHRRRRNAESDWSVCLAVLVKHVNIWVRGIFKRNDENTDVRY